MAKSLQEQLLSAGLVKPKQAIQLKQEKRKDAKHQPKKQAAQPTPAQIAAEQARLKKAERDRELNRQRQIAIERRAITAQVDQIIEGHRQPTGVGDIGFQFVVRGKIKKLYLTEEQHAGISSGALAIVRYQHNWVLVDQETAARVAERDPRSVASLQNETTEAEDEAYANYKVPDDLRW